MKRYKKWVLGFVILFVLTFQSFSQAAFTEISLKWDGKSTDLKEIAKKLDYDLVDAEGNYKPMYFFAAEQLWEKGLFLGANGTFHLDKPFTRTEGIVMIIRLLGKEADAQAAKEFCPFKDVPSWAKNYVGYAFKHGLTTGYSADVFGAQDSMTANQYLTFVLRALEYNDKAGDFSWDKAAEKALQINLIGDSCKEQYMRSNLFLRDNVAIISYRAAFEIKTKTGKELEDSIIAKRPDGTVPYATMAAKIAAESQMPPKPTMPSLVYDTFDTPQYESVDATAARKVVKQDDTHFYLAYSNHADKEDEYQALLSGAGFSYQGEIQFEPERVTSVTGGIVQVGTKAWSCDWYSKGKIQVVFGEIGNAFIVRIYKGEVDSFDVNAIRRFYREMKSN